MSTPTNPYKRHRFPPEIIQYTVWLYHRFNLSHRDIEDLLAERGIEVSYESIRLWCNKFGPQYAARLKRRHQGFGDTFFIDEVFVKICGKLLIRTERWSMCFCRSDGMAQLLRNNHGDPRKIVTDKLRSYGVAHRDLFNLDRNLVSAKHYRLFRQRAFASWEYATAL